MSCTKPITDESGCGGVEDCWECIYSPTNQKNDLCCGNRACPDWFDDKCTNLTATIKCRGFEAV
jgi:hypothetical protein